MARPQKSLLELVRESTFRSRRHHELLAKGELLQWRTLSKLQERYREADNEFERRRIGVEFENAIPVLHQRQERSRKSLDEVLDSLGPPQSADRVVNFFPRFFRHYAGPRAGRPFRLESFQEDFIRPFWTRDRSGARVYNFGLFAVPKGNGKTPLAAVLGTNALMDPPVGDTPEVYGLAGARKQAGFAQKFVKKAIERGDLGSFLRQSGSTITCPERDGTYEILSAEGELAHGVNPSASIVDEWWQFKHRSQREGLNALSEALQKRPGESWLLAISQAYYDFGSMLAEAHQAALKHPKLRVERNGCLHILEDTDSGFLMHWFGAPPDADIEDPKIVRACNPLSTLEVKSIIAQLHRPGADEADWRRLHLNQPTKGQFSWLPAGAWRRLSTADDVQVPVGADIYIGVDAAYSGDTTAVVFAWRDSNGRIHLRARVWSAIASNVAHEYPRGGTLDNEQLVLPYIFELARNYRVREIVFDPEYFASEAAKLGRAGFKIAAVYPQSKDMSDAVRSLKRGVDEGKVGHDGDQVLTAHVEAAQAVKTYRGTKEFEKISKDPETSDRIDAATAACMAHWRALLAPEGGFVGGAQFGTSEDEDSD